MQTAIAIFPLIILAIVYVAVFGLIAAYARLASHILHKEAISWRLSLIFSLAIIALTVLGRIVALVAKISVPTILALAFSLVLYSALGGWLFSGHKVSENGPSLGWLAGARIGAFAFLFVILTGFIVYGAFHVLSQLVHS
jgi:hypothetical protein